MTKSDLVELIAKKAGLIKKDSAKVIDVVVDGVTHALSKGDTVQLVGFGTFSVRKREARKGRNPQTGAEIKIAARKVPVFKAGKALKEAVEKK